MAGLPARIGERRQPIEIPAPRPYTLQHLQVEGHQAAPAARPAGQTTLDPAYVADWLTRYDQQVSNG